MFHLNAVYFAGIVSVLLMGKIFGVVSNDSLGYFAICTFARNEPDLPEWIEYHSRMGASKIYLYDHNSSPSLLNFIVPYVESGLVEYQYVTNKLKEGSNFHEKVVADCILKNSKHHNFIAFIDADEFIVLKDKTKSIPDILRNYEQFGGLAINWKLFTSSGHITRPHGGVLANYNMCIKHCFVKTILNTKVNHGVALSLSPHIIQSTVSLNAIGTEVDLSTTDAKYFTVDPTMRHVIRSFWHPADCGLNATYHNVSKATDDMFDIIYIHHYWSKSLQDYMGKLARHESGDRVETTKATMYWFDQYEEQNTTDCGYLEMPPAI